MKLVVGTVVVGDIISSPRTRPKKKGDIIHWTDDNGNYYRVDKVDPDFIQISPIPLSCNLKPTNGSISVKRKMTA